jgi:hypothetical protein
MNYFKFFVNLNTNKTNIKNENRSIKSNIIDSRRGDFINQLKASLETVFIEEAGFIGFENKFNCNFINIGYYYSDDIYEFGFNFLKNNLIYLNDIVKFATNFKNNINNSIDSSLVFTNYVNFNAFKNRKLKSKKFIKRWYRRDDKEYLSGFRIGGQKYTGFGQFNLLDDDEYFNVIKYNNEEDNEDFHFIMEEDEAIKLYEPFIVEEEMQEKFDDFFEQDLDVDLLLEYFYDNLRLKLDNEKNIIFNVHNLSFTKDISFMDGNNFFRNFFFSDFSFDLSNNLTVEVENEFNNYVFFSKYNLFKYYNLLDMKSLDWKVGFTSKTTDPDIRLYANTGTFTYLYSFDFILKYTLSFFFCFFLPFVFYSFFEIFLIIYLLFYFFSWTLPSKLQDLVIIKLLKLFLVVVIGERKYDDIFCYFYNPNPVCLILTERIQFFIFIFIIFFILMWFFSYFIVNMTELFSFFTNIVYKYLNVYDESIVETLNEEDVTDDTMEDDIFTWDFDFEKSDPIMVEEAIGGVLGEDHILYVTPLSYLYETITESILFVFCYILYDLYITSFFNSEFIIFFF